MKTDRTPTEFETKVLKRISRNGNVDIDKGVTPFAIACRATPNCHGFMHSSFYRCDQGVQAQFEWYRPETVDGLDEAVADHVMRGGLILRAVGESGEDVKPAISDMPDADSDEINAEELTKELDEFAIYNAIIRLAEIAEDSNNAQEEPEERGRGNSAYGIIVFEDGSGKIVEMSQPMVDNQPFSNMTTIHEFATPEEGMKLLGDM